MRVSDFSRLMGTRLFRAFVSIKIILFYSLSSECYIANPKSFLSPPVKQVYPVSSTHSACRSRFLTKMPIEISQILTANILSLTRKSETICSSAIKDNDTCLSDKISLWKRLDNEVHERFELASIGMTEVIEKVLHLASCEGGVEDMKPVWELVENLEIRGLAPSAMAVSRLLEIGVTLSAAGNATIADGVRILDWARTRGIVPGTVLFSLHMDLLSKAAIHGNACSEDGFALLQTMAEAEADANVVTFTALLDLVGHAISAGRGTPSDIARARAAMASAGVAPNGRSRTALLAAYAAAAKRGHAAARPYRRWMRWARRGGPPADGRLPRPARA